MHRWLRCAPGLPHADCYDLVYRHGLAVGSAGHSLMMGSTIRGLWSSEDGSDRWSFTSAHLPLICAVRFG